MVGKKLWEAKELSKVNALICAVDRNGEVFIPDGNFVLQENDNITVAAEAAKLVNLMHTLKMVRRPIDNVMIIGGSHIGIYLTEKLLKMGLAEDEIHRPVSQLSGGQKRRVAILRALVSDSDAVFMDEPFKGLDDETRYQVTQQVKENLNGRLLMVITHNEEDATALGATIINL